jgi:hypothetical protein
MQQTIYSFEVLEQMLARFRTISLLEMDSAKLQNRVEKKFVMHLSRIESLLSIALQDYRVLEIDNTRLLEYSTEYYDTKDDAMYLAHHNGKQNRFKVRKREYLISGEQFLEVKRRLNNGRIQKKRVELDGAIYNESSGQLFIENATPYKLDGLEKKLVNAFHRITLVNELKNERVTIDLGLRFNNPEASINLPAVAIIEVKQEKTGSQAGFELILRNLGIHSFSVSKYCIGRALLEPTLKASLFQNKLRYLTKLNAIVYNYNSKI